MAGLHAGLAEMAVVEHDDREIAGGLARDREQAADAHQLLAIAGDDEHRALRLRQREAKAHMAGAAHGAPQIEVARVVAGVEHVVGGEPRPLTTRGRAVGKQRLDRGAAVEFKCGPSLVSVHFLRPSMRCESSTATGWSPSKASERGRRRRSLRRPRRAPRRRHVTPMISNACGGRLAHRDLPGIELGPFAAHRHQSQEREAAGRNSDNMLTQLPTPLDCISSTARSPPSQAPAASATPSSSVVSTVVLISGSACAQLDQPGMTGVGHIGDLRHAHAPSASGRSQPASRSRRPAFGERQCSLGGLGRKARVARRLGPRL